MHNNGGPRRRLQDLIHNLFVLPGTWFSIDGMRMKLLIRHCDPKVLHYKALLIPTLGLFALSAS
jgi:hypothetical protein